MSSINKLNLFLAAVVALLAVLFFLPEEHVYTPLTNIKANDISSITISSKHRKLVFNKIDQQWTLQTTPEKTIEAKTITKLLGILKTHSHRQFENTANNRLAFELNNPVYRIEIDSLHIEFGITDPVEELRYILLNNKIHLINDTYLQFLLADESFFYAKVDAK